MMLLTTPWLLEAKASSPNSIQTAKQGEQLAIMDFQAVVAI